MTICIYHGGCPDGFTAAWAVHKRFPDWTFHPGIYGEAPPDVAGEDVVLVDFSYKRPVIEEMAAHARSILVLDHHKSAAEDLEPFGNQQPTNWEAWLTMIRPGCISAIFDTEQSGAMLAWEFFHPHLAPPRLVQYVQDRDLWRFRLPHSREINAYILAHRYDWRTWDELHYELQYASLRDIADRGEAIETKHHKDVAELVDELARPMAIAGHTVLMANLPKTYASDAGHELAKRSTPGFGGVYWDAPHGRVFSLRSLPGGPDVSMIARHYGGGGHAHAAGFTRPHGWYGDGADLALELEMAP